MFILKYFLFALVVIKYSSSLIAYDCFHDRSNITAVSLLSISPCKSSSDIDVITKVSDIQLIQSKLFEKVKIQHCSIAIIKTIYYCGMHNHISIVDRGLTSYIKEMTREECIGLHKGNKVKIEGVNTITVLPNSTTDHQFTLVGTVDSYGNCNGVTYMYNSLNYYKAVVQVSVRINIKDYYTSLDLSQSTVTFNDGTTCKSDQIACIHPSFGYSYWSIDDLLNCRTTNKDVIYQGKANVTSMTGEMGKGAIIGVNSGDQVFKIVLGDKKKVCDQIAYETEEKRMYIVPKLMDDFYFDKKKIEGNNIDFTSYLNYKISYVFDHISNKIDEVYRSIMTKSCEIERKTLHNKLRLARNHPQTLGNIISDDPGYMSVIAGEVLHIIQCQLVEVNLRRTSRCYNNIPIAYMNESYYLEPFSKIITNLSEEVHCSPITPVMYNLDGAWYSLTPQAVKVLEPVILGPSIQPLDLNYSSVNSMLKSGIYDNEAMASFKDFMLFPMVKYETNSYMAAKGTGSSIYENHALNNHLIIDIKSLKQQANEAIREFFGWTETFGAYMGALLGIGMIYKILTKICSTMLNGATLYSAFGCGFHLLASLMTSLTHLVFQRNKNKDRSQDVELGMNLNELLSNQHEEIPLANAPLYPLLQEKHSTYKPVYDVNTPVQ